MNNHQHIHRLFEKYLNNSCTHKEAEELIRLLQSNRDRIYFEQLIEKHLQTHKDFPVGDEVIARVFAKLDLSQHSAQTVRKPQPFYIGIAAAAAIFIAITIGGYHYYYQNRHTATTMAATIQDVAPGSNRATLTLEDGRTIDLSADQAGIIVSDDKIVYADGTSLMDKESKVQDSLSIINYQLSTPKGGQYQVTLPDGTKVWLNAASTLKYPNLFTGDKRVVQLEGEAYFEVSREHTSNRPFIVQAADQEIEVLGTQFNVNAYPDENNTKTTLLTGSVCIRFNQSYRGNHPNAPQIYTLKPGEQCKTGPTGTTITNVDIETVVDWKAGDFIFVDEDLKSIMRKVARWYDIEVIFGHDLSNDTYNAHISRNKNLSEILRILELSGGLTSKIENNTLFLSSPQ